jgi:acyl-coenzyme A thioesterase PaaI-like protein
MNKALSKKGKCYTSTLDFILNYHTRMTEQQLVDQFTSQGWESFTDEGFIQTAGPFFYKNEGDNVHFLFPTGTKHKNLRSVVQGGALMTFADRAFGVVARHTTDTKSTATIQFNYQFVDAVQIGDTVELTPCVIKSTKSMVFLNGALMVGDRTVGFATGVWKRFL